MNSPGGQCSGREDLQVVPVEDPKDPRLDDYRIARDRDLLRDQGIFVAEGRYVVERFLRTRRFPIRSLLVLDATFRLLHHLFRETLSPEVAIYSLARPVMDEVIGFNHSQGCLAVGEVGEGPSPGEIMTGSARLLVLEDITNPDNVGGLFRSGGAFGVDGILTSPRTADPLYRKSIRTSMGASLVIPTSRIDPWPESLDVLRSAGFILLALTTDPGSISLEDYLTHEGVPERFALVLGNEKEGLTSAAVARSDEAIRIPMACGVDSLNVATAGSIALYRLGPFQQERSNMDGPVSRSSEGQANCELSSLRPPKGR